MEDADVMLSVNNFRQISSTAKLMLVNFNQGAWLISAIDPPC
jgi:hypothetical protein